MAVRLSPKQPPRRHDKKNNSRKHQNRIDNTKKSVYNKKYQKDNNKIDIGADCMKQFKQELFELLTIQAPSGKEEKVVKYVQPILETLCDEVFIDAYGNLLATKKVGSGTGATVVLSAHMDSVSDIRRGRKVLWNEETQTFRSSKGVLGADDRAGIAIILAVLRNIDKAGFDGTIKVCFSREEEIGCVGAEEIPVDFYSDANLAVVVDRRGNRDVVTGCGVMYGFCSKEVGSFFEDVSALLDMEWKAVPGGVSDAMTFSSNGIHSVNLSAGYQNEHTDSEFVHVPSCRDTINLILQAFSVINSQYHKFGEVPKTAKWSYSDYGYSASRFDKWDMYDMQDEYRFNGEVTFYDMEDTFGGVVGSTVSGYVSLHQAAAVGGDKLRSQEVFMDEKNFRKMIDQYCLVTGYKAGYQLQAEAEQDRIEQRLKALINETDDYGQGGTHYTSNNGKLVAVSKDDLPF